MTPEQEAWIKAYCAWIPYSKEFEPFNTAKDVADKCLEDFEKKFPNSRKCSNQFIR